MPYVDDMPELARATVRARIRKDLSERDYRRALHSLAEAGHSQREISRWLGITQPSVASALKTAADVVKPLDGFSGATPYEICERFAAGLIDRAQLIEELTRFPYRPSLQTKCYGSTDVNPPSTWSEVEAAEGRGLIDETLYSELLHARPSH